MRRILLLLLFAVAVAPALAQRTHKPPLHGKDWMVVTGKPLGAAAGARTFMQGGNAVDAACAMLAATATMWDDLGWGGEMQALIWDPRTKKVVGINALGVAPSRATPEFFRAKGLDYPPPYGPLAAVTPGTPGGLLVMLAEYGRLSLAQVLHPAIEMADGYPMEAEAEAARAIELERKEIEQWPDSRRLFFPNPGGHGARAEPTVPPARAGCDLAQTRRRRTPGAGCRSGPQGRDPRRVRPLLQGGHR